MLAITGGQGLGKTTLARKITEGFSRANSAVRIIPALQENDVVRLPDFLLMADALVPSRTNCAPKSRYFCWSLRLADRHPRVFHNFLILRTVFSLALRAAREDGLSASSAEPITARYETGIEQSQQVVGGKHFGLRLQMCKHVHDNFLLMDIEIV